MGIVGGRGAWRTGETAGDLAGATRQRRLRARLLIVAATVAAISGCARSATTTTGAPEGSRFAVTTTVPCAPQVHSDGGDGSGCGNASLEVQHAANMHYADRMPISGPDARAEAWQPVIRRALEPLAKSEKQATQQQVLAALRRILPATTSIQVATNAVRTDGTAFGIEIGNGCVTGSVFGHILTVELNGFVNDGGCLAVYGH